MSKYYYTSFLVRERSRLFGFRLFLGLLGAVARSKEHLMSISMAVSPCSLLAAGDCVGGSGVVVADELCWFWLGV